MPTADPTAPHVIDAPATRPHRTLPSGWLRGLVAGVEAAMLSWLTVVVPAVATYVATAAAPALGEASWQAAAGLGTSVWLLGHGGSMYLAPTAVLSVLPLGVTLLSLALSYGATRRMRLTTGGAAAFVPVGFFLVTSLAGALAAVPGARLLALAGAVVVSAAGAALALWRVGAHVGWLSRAWARVPTAVTAGLAGGARAIAALAVLAAAAVTVAAVAGWDRVLQVQAAYAPDVVSGVVMVLAQLVFVPTAVVWAGAWLAGPGFAVGQGTLFSASEVITAPLPAVPMLGALPSPGSPALGWVVALPVVVGALVGWWLDRRRRQHSLAGAAGAALTAATTAALAALALAAAAAGSLGPGRMAVVGPEPLAVAALLLAEVGGGALLTALALHPATRAAVGARVGRLWVRGPRAGGTAAPAPADPAPADPAPAARTARADAVAGPDTPASGAPARTAAPLTTDGGSVEARSDADAPTDETPAAAPAPESARTSRDGAGARGDRDANARDARGSARANSDRGWGGTRLSEWSSPQDA
ncbi:cell division protein PerM [Georgenia yuyongxinii]